MPEPVRSSTPAQERASGCFIRLAWMLLGSVVLAFSTFLIATSSGAFFSRAD